MKNFLFITFSFIFFSSIIYSQTTYPNNEDGVFQDMLTPQYYLSEDGSPFRDEVNRFVYFARMERFHHPLEDSTGEMPQYSIPRYGEFAAGRGPTRTHEHHGAIDMYVGNNETKVNMYAAHDGYVAVYRNAPKYRHYLSITKNVEDSTGEVIGKIVTLYAHIDLDLDSTDNILLNGQFVNKGDLVSKNFYSDTRGGPHIQFEIRYYRTENIGNETFYGWIGPGGSSTLTEPSEGIWSYGFWNPDTGYGFADPANHLPGSVTSIKEGLGIEVPTEYKLFQNYPNPFNPSTVIKYQIPSNVKGEMSNIKLIVYDILGREVATLVNKTQPAGSYEVKFSSTGGASFISGGLSSGVYFYRLTANDFVETKKLILLE
ncbi:MAG: T9SS type A sorting domain-containing protein [Melioribacteraceae bacterium]|nr:T9SS type A sorting domain-containing protein [Melioribacteraceae bacterium]